MTQDSSLDQRLIDVAGGSVQVFLGGAGEVVTCLASPTGITLPHQLAEFALGAGRIVAINPRGAGRSSPLDKAAGPIRQLVSDAEVVRQHLGIERWVLLGQSRSGWLALEYALCHPSSVAGLILTDTASSWRFNLDPDSLYNNRRDDFRQVQEIRARALAADATVEDLKRWMRLTYHQPEAIERLASQRIAARRNPTSIPVEVPELVVAMMDEVLGRPPHSGRWDVTDRLHEISAPTLIIHGRFDNIIPPRWGELLHERIAGSEVLLVKAATSPSTRSPRRCARRSSASSRVVASFRNPPRPDRIYALGHHPAEPSGRRASRHRLLGRPRHERGAALDARRRARFRTRTPRTSASRTSRTTTRSRAGRSQYGAEQARLIDCRRALVAGGHRGAAVRRVPHLDRGRAVLQHHAARPRRHRHAARRPR